MKKIGNHDINEIAERYGTPLYVYDRHQIERNYEKLVGALEKHYEKSRVHFSVKANSNVHILSVLREKGAGADCSSPLELLLSRKAGFSDKDILYTGNYESPGDFEYMKNSNLRINLDDISSFRRMIKNIKPEIIAFRINPGIGRGGFEGITTAGADAKFGVPYEMAEEAYRMAMDTGIERFGIHMMTGSNNLEPYYFAEIVDKLLTIAGIVFNKLGIVPEYVDIGGGLGVPYVEGEQELNVDLMAQLVAERFMERCKKNGFGVPELILEPGRYLLANAGWLLTRITGIKNSYKTFIGLDAGMNTLLRPALYNAKHQVSVYGKDNNIRLVNLCGQICENSDIFAQNVPFPDVEEGDLVIFSEAGAYGYVMSSVYNGRPRPAEVLLADGETKLIRRRENFEDILSLYE